MISAIVLAAGESKRMGAENKLLLPFSGKPLIRHVVEMVRAAEVGEVIVVVGHEAGRVRAALAGLEVKIVENPDYAQGMTTTIHAGVRAAAPEADGFMICLSDLPLIEPEELNQLIEAFGAARREDEEAIVVPTHGGQRGNPVLFSSFYRPDILAQRGVMGCKGIVKGNPQHVCEVEMASDHVLRDVDTPEAYWREVAAR